METVRRVVIIAVSRYNDRVRSRRGADHVVLNQFLLERG